MHKAVKLLHTRKPPLTPMDTKLLCCKLTNACAAATLYHAVIQSPVSITQK